MISLSSRVCKTAPQKRHCHDKKMLQHPLITNPNQSTGRSVMAKNIISKITSIFKAAPKATFIQRNPMIIKIYGYSPQHHQRYPIQCVNGHLSRKGL